MKPIMDYAPVRHLSTTDSNNSKNSGNETATHSASLISVSPGRSARPRKRHRDPMIAARIDRRAAKFARPGNTQAVFELFNFGAHRAQVPGSRGDAIGFLDAQFGGVADFNPAIDCECRYSPWYGSQSKAGLNPRRRRIARQGIHRIAATARNLRAMGAEVEEFKDGLRVAGPAQLRGATIDPRGDHRIAMAFSVAG